MKTKNQFSITRLIAVGCLLPLLFSCGGGNNGAGSERLRKSCVDSINSVEAKLKNLTAPNPVIYNEAINSYTHFATSFPNDSMAAGCLFRAAIFSANLNQYQRALSIYDTINRKYPNFKDGADCLFNQAYIYDDKLKDTAKAHAMYLMVINKYPHDSLASQARAAISLLGKSTDEIIKEFEEKNKAQKKS